MSKRDATEEITESGLGRNSLFLQGSSWPWNMLVHPIERPLVICTWEGDSLLHTAVYAQPCPSSQLLPSLAFAGVTFLSALTQHTLVHYTINAPLDPWNLGHLSSHGSLPEVPVHQSRIATTLSFPVLVRHHCSIQVAHTVAGTQLWLL